MGMCVMIKLVEGRIAWTLDRGNSAFDMYKASQFMLSLLMAYRLVSERLLVCSCSVSKLCCFNPP